MRALHELVNDEEPALPVVREWIARASNEVLLLPCDPAAGDRTLLELQVTTRSPMGAIAHRTGGLLVDDGWVRVLGAGCDRIPRSIADWNGMSGGQATRIRGAVLVGDDAVGDFFAISGGGLAVPPGHVGYYAPDALDWEDTGLRYSDWLTWLFEGDLEGYYESARWPGWREEIRDLPGDRAIHIHPWLFTQGPPVEERSRAAVPVEELWKLYVEDLPSRLREPPTG